MTAALRGNYHCDQDGDETKLVAYGGNNTKGPIDVATACNASASASGRQDFESETFVMQERMEAENPKSGPGGKGWSDKGIAFTLEARTRPQSVAFAQNQRGELRESKVSPQITCGGGKPGEGYPAIRSGSAVRRLTPTECERLQGFPDDWTLYGADGEQMSDSARYRMLGNAVTVNVAEWIGRRIVETTP